MGLFNKIRDQLFAARELEFNRTKLQKDIAELSGKLYDYRGSEAHEIFASYLRALLNLEILSLSSGKERSAEAYAYSRGRIEGLRHALNLRERFVEEKRLQRTGNQPSDHPAKRSYFTPRPTSAMAAGISD